MRRRNFLTAILAACAAPAIVRSESLMKIYVPKADIIDPYAGMSEDFTVESWIYSKDLKRYPDMEINRWFHVAKVRENGIVNLYVDGIIMNNALGVGQAFDEIVMPIVKTKTLVAGSFDGFVNELRVTNGVARKIETPALTSLNGLYLG